MPPVWILLLLVCCGCVYSDVALTAPMKKWDIILISGTEGQMTKWLCSTKSGTGGTSLLPVGPNYPNIRFLVPDAAQSLRLSVAYAGIAVLPCDGSALLNEDVEIQWEAMGSDVAAIKGDTLVIDERYKDRVYFGSEEQRGAGDWSIALDAVMLSDSNMYECIWRGQRTLSTVWLTVEPPQVDRVIEEFDNKNVTLPCFLDLPRNQSPQDLRVWWEKYGEVLIERKENRMFFHAARYGTDIFNYLSPRTIDEFPLFFTTNTSAFSFGEYSCWYQTKDSDDPKPGIPGTITVMEIESSGEPEDSPEEWSSAMLGPTFFWLSVGVEDSTTEETPVVLHSATPPMEAVTEPLPMEAFEETATSFPDEGSPEAPESLDWTDFPWVRTGLIAGVLLVTAVVLCILGALHKL